MISLKRLVEMSLLWRVWNSLVWGMRKVRLHPLARIEGDSASLQIGRGSKIGPGSILSIDKSAGIRIGADCWVYRDVELRTNGEIVIGDRTTLQKGVTLNGNVSIGAACIIAPNVFASSGAHIYDKWPEIPIREQERRLISTSRMDEATEKTHNYDQPIEIGEDCWIGINAVVLRGVVVGRGSIVGANAVVTKSVEPYSIVAGVPAKRIGARLSWVPPASLDATIPESIPYLYEGFVIAYCSGSISAFFSKDVKIALELSNSTILEVLVESSAKGVISCGPKDTEFVEGRNCIYLEIPEEEIRIDNFPRLLELSVKYNSLEGNLRLISCQLVK